MLVRLSLMLIIGGSAAVALGQSNGNTNDNSSVIDRSPQENVRSANVAARSPGNSVIRPALARHQGLINDRLHGGGSEDESTSGTGTGSGSGTTGTGTGTSGGTNDALSGLLSSLTGGSIGSGSIDALLGLLGNEGVSSILGNSLGSLLGNGAGATTPTSADTNSNTTGATGGTTTGATPTAAQQSSLELLLALRDQNAAGGSSSTSKTVQPAAADTTNVNAGRGVVNSATSTKTTARQQTNGGTDDEPTFRVRLYDSLLGTLLAALTVGFSLRDFIDSIKDALRPVFGLPAPAPTTQPSANSGGSQVRHFATLTESMAAVGSSA